MSLEEVQKLLELTPEEKIRNDKYVKGLKIKTNLFKFLYKNFIGMTVISLLIYPYISIIFPILSYVCYMIFNEYKSIYLKATMTDVDYFNLLNSLRDENFDPKEASDEFYKNKKEY